MTTDEFREGWSFIKGRCATLEKRILKSGWNFIRMRMVRCAAVWVRHRRKPLQRAQAGSSPREHALYACKLEHIELTVPMVFSGQVQGLSVSIQEGAIFAVPDEAVAEPIPGRTAG